MSTVNKFRLALLATAGAALLPVTGLQADPMDINATVGQVCALQVTSDMTITDGGGDLVPGTGNDGVGVGTFEWRCSDQTAASITIDDGVSGNRTLNNGSTADSISYALCQDDTSDGVCNTPWDDTEPNDLDVLGAGMAASNWASVDVNGLVLAADYDSVEPLTYSDTVEVTITIDP